ncbi:MAG TPA: hypothetical protein VFZ65_03625 [Planctomycetota bacterium]|nr:hypothetical protein [Planctomycetota bacterium]
MNRTTIAVSFVMAAAAVQVPGQVPGTPATAAPQGDPIAEIVASMRAAEQKAKTLRIELETEGRLPDGSEVTTHGTLRVLRGAQPKLYSSVEFSFGDGLSGRMESAQTERGIYLYEDNPSFGELHLHFPAAVVTDLEWAGEVLERADLPGMADRRATSPLGSAMLADLQRHFDLAPTARTTRGADAGQWLAGARRAGLDDQDPELPLADRVELFVRERDHALLEVKHLQADKVIQHLEVVRLEVDVDLPASSFEVDGRGQRLRELQQYQPMADEVERVLRQAEAKSPEGTVRPSRR